jgi:hypothetical protein
MLGETCEIVRKREANMDDEPCSSQQGIQACFPVAESHRKRRRLCGKTVLVNKVCDHSYTKFQFFAMIFGQEKI